MLKTSVLLHAVLELIISCAKYAQQDDSQEAIQGALNKANAHADTQKTAEVIRNFFQKTLLWTANLDVLLSKFLW